MTPTEMAILAQDCYAAFNQNSPPASSRAVSLWAGICISVPLEAAPWIRGKIVELDSLPRNFGKAVLGLYREWLASRGGGQQAQQARCPNCDKQMAGWFWAWKKTPDGHAHSFLCRCCSQDFGFDNVPLLSRRQAEKNGWLVLPEGKSWVEFDAELLGSAGHDRSAYHDTLTAPPDMGRQRYAHVNALAEAETGGPW